MGASDHPTHLASILIKEMIGNGLTCFPKIGDIPGPAISKAVSYGNACDLDAPELLEYLAEHSQTRVIGAYVKGVKEGHRFFRPF